MEKINFYIPDLNPDAVKYVNTALHSGKSLFRGDFHEKCTQYFDTLFFPSKSYLVSSCTDAICMALITLELQQRDEIIIPSFTFVSVANALKNRGCQIKLADSLENSPDMDLDSVKKLITSETKAVIDVYYGGIVSEENLRIRQFCKENNLFYIADAAHLLISEQTAKTIIEIADITVFSFHETKVLNCGQGGLMVLNRNEKNKTANEIYNHGTDKFSLNISNKKFYEWTNEGLEFNLNEISCALLWSQIEGSKKIIDNLRKIVLKYNECLKALKNSGKIKNWSESDASSFCPTIMYLVLDSDENCINLKEYLSYKNIDTRQHYYPLHQSQFYREKLQQEDNCNNASNLYGQLLRLPLYNSLSQEDVITICNSILTFYGAKDSALV
ncbi:aminotransferase class I/II-fold pyridoxal phosphate-dependent enzyme [Flavobacterium fluviatile]|uniref:aminotransferase class I/II-fold pyridoxal phosphate-dependent enzyme n=1 Tax=Flavobacterium fluviatile TaxID=1862387 RepID=UPI0013D7BA25|nr:aminotransferase class I/II-fold pyridoxal phosphate-dependent enzyme [Flavobacterium fluviatile]